MASSKRILFGILITASICALHLQLRSTRWWEFASTFLTSISTATKNLRQMDTTSTTSRSATAAAAAATNTNDNMYFNVICSKNETNLPSVTLSQLHMNGFQDGIAEVKIHTVSQKPKRKSASDDVILVWAEQVDGAGRSSGIVRSNGNGNYTGHLRIFWPGLTRVKAKIADSVVNTCLRYNALIRYGNTVYSSKTPHGLSSVFNKDGIEDRRRCGVTSELYGYQNVCNYTTLNDGNPWYCGKPQSRNLTCYDIESFSQGPFIVTGVKDQDKVHHPGHGTLRMTATVESFVDPHKEPNQLCKHSLKRETWTKDTTSGFYDKVWNPIKCRVPEEHTYDSYRICLQGKTIAFIGDSTVRQYCEYILRHIFRGVERDLKHEHGPDRIYNAATVITRHNITTYFRKHEQPWHLPDIMPNGIKSTPTMLREMANSDAPDTSMIIILNYFSHFLFFSASHFRQTIHRLAAAVKYLLEKKPRAVVFYKGPHVCKLDTSSFDMHFALLFRDILFEEFSELMDSVIYLDTWDITVAHGSEEMHPTGDCLESQIQQMMAYLCE